jgi:hypothetical protein
LADHSEFKSHSRFIDREQARGFGLEVDDLEKDQGLQDDVLSVFHATTHTFNATAVTKIIENHVGKAFIKMAPQQITVQPQLARNPIVFPPQAVPVPPAQP